jgi:hypothetical protein
MSTSDIIRKYSFAYENKDRTAVEALLTTTSYLPVRTTIRIDRETYFKRCWPYSDQSPTYEIEKMRNSRLSIEHDPARLPMMAFAVNESGSNG